MADPDADLSLRPEDAREWTAEEVGDWLAAHGLTRYRSTFESHGLTGAALMDLDADTMAELVPEEGGRDAVMAAIGRLRGPAAPEHVGDALMIGVTGLASKVYGGLSHLVKDPMEGASRAGTTGFFEGLGHGLMEAFVQPAEGVAIFTHHLGSSLSKAPEVLFHDAGVPPPPSTSAEARIQSAKPAFLRPQPTKPPAHVGEGLLYGLQSLGSGMYDGMAGMVTEPLKAARTQQGNAPRDVNAAVARGVLKGLTGALCKPLGGGLELVTSTVDGLLNTPAALIAATKEGPSLVDTPTFQRLASLTTSRPSSFSPFSSTIHELATSSHRGQVKALTGDGD